MSIFVDPNIKALRANSEFAFSALSLIVDRVSSSYRRHPPRGSGVHDVGVPSHSQREMWRSLEERSNYPFSSKEA